MTYINDPGKREFIAEMKNQMKFGFMDRQIFESMYFLNFVTEKAIPMRKGLKLLTFDEYYDILESGKDDEPDDGYV